MRGGRERRGAVGRRLRGQRRGGERYSEAGGRPAGAGGRASPGGDARRHDHRRGLEPPRGARRRPDQGDAGLRRRARPGAGPRPGRPSAERDHAAERARGGRGGARPAPVRRRAGARLRGDLGRRAPGRAGRHLRERRADPRGAGDRGGQHLQARHALFRAARCSLSRRRGPGAADLDGLLRHRPGPDRGGRDRAVRGRAGDLLAARGRAIRRRARDARGGGRGGARGVRPALLRAARGRARGDLRRTHGQRGGEVRRRRAAGVPAAPDRGQEEPRGRRGRRPDPPRPGQAVTAARGRRRGGRGAVADPPMRRDDVAPAAPRPAAATAAASDGERPPLTWRRLLGLDRSAGPPPETRRGEELHPWTLPNAIGFLRIALIPVFLVLALESDDGRDTAATILFAFIAGADYLDGMVARVTGQYSRLGALLDPLTDRLLVIAGAIVAWEFDLLPHWALLVLALREAFMLLLTQIALRRGLDLSVNMLGRWAVWPVMGAIALAMIVETWVSDALLIFGLALTLAATALYLQDGLRALREGSTST